MGRFQADAEMVAEGACVDHVAVALFGHPERLGQPRACRLKGDLVFGAVEIQVYGRGLSPQPVEILVDKNDPPLCKGRAADREKMASARRGIFPILCPVS